MTFMAGLKQYFGLLEGQSIREFAQECKALTYDDKLELAEGMRKTGLEVDDPKPPSDS